MDVFELDDEAVGRELMSFEVKALAGFGKDGGEKNFEGTITDLQMQTYLIMSRFAQKKNKKGESYGWHIAAMETPETKWGRDFVTSEYKADPSFSWNQIVSQVKQQFPSATDEAARRILGIRWPGQNTAAVKIIKEKEKIRPPKEWIIPSNPKYYDIIHAFDNMDVIDWKQGAGIKKGDMIFMYVGAPVSAILYKCKVTETNIPYQYQDKNLTITALMKIKLLRRYDPSQFTFDVLKSEYGIYAVRGPRGIPNSLSEALGK
jgi:hypothetical protein